MGAGVRPTEGQVEAITFLVASAVDGLTSEGVSVLDDSGRLLSAAMEMNAPARTDRRRLEMQYDLEEHLETRVSGLLEPIVGLANVRVRVSAELDFEEVQRRTEAVDPNQVALTGEARSEIEPGDPAMGASSTIQNNTFEVTRKTELSNRLPGAVRRLTVAVALNDQAIGSDGDADLASIEQLVARAVGLDTGRGDEISVLAVPFELVEPIQLAGLADAASTPLDLLREFKHQLILAVALLLAFILALRGLSMVRAAIPAPGALPGSPQGTLMEPGAAGDPQPGGEKEIPAARMDPAQLIRSWLTEA
jgi:flagellar M-ring protein FliF